MRRKSVIRILATVAAAALALAPALPAAAHTSDMYTYVVYDSMSEQAGYAQYGKTDGSITPLPTTFVPVEPTIEGIEVSDEAGTEIGYGLTPPDLTPYVRQWNHRTGEVGARGPVHVVAPDPTFYAFHGLDTSIDGRTLTVLEYASGTSDHVGIATVDAATGALTPFLDITDVMFVPPDLFMFYAIDSLATHPLTGITYVFMHTDSNWAYYLPLDVVAGTVGEPVRFMGENLQFGRVQGADFDADGTLYFNFLDQTDEPIETYELSTLANGVDYATASRSVISDAPALSEQIRIAQLALTIDRPALPATGASLSLALWTFGVAAIVAGVVAVGTARRSRRSGRPAA